MNLFEYKINIATLSNIESHLFRCSDMFSPPLNEIVNISNYAKKLRKHALTLEAWHDDELIGLVACYMNNKESLSGYISNVSVCNEYMGMGIATKLLERTIQIAFEKKYNFIELEVGVDNQSAIKLYHKCGFIITEESTDKLKMKILLNNE